MNDLNHWRKILKEKKFQDDLVEGKIVITPDQEEDKEIAKQLESILNHHIRDNYQWTSHSY